MPGRPLLLWHKLRWVAPGVKRLHDWYKRVSSVEINAFSATIATIASLSGPNKVMVDFKDIDLMFQLGRLDIQLT